MFDFGGIIFGKLLKNLSKGSFKQKISLYLQKGSFDIS